MPFFQQVRCLQERAVVPGFSLTQQGRQVGTDAIQIVFRTLAGRFLLSQQPTQAGLFRGMMAGLFRRLGQHVQVPEPVGVLRRHGPPQLRQQGRQRCPQGLHVVVQALQARVLLLQLRLKAQTGVHAVQGGMDGARGQIFRQAQGAQARCPACPGRLQLAGRFPRAAAAVLQGLAAAFQQPGTGRGLGGCLLMPGAGLFRLPAEGKSAADGLRQVGAGGIGRKQGQQVAHGCFRLLQGQGRMSGIVPGRA